MTPVTYIASGFADTSWVVTTAGVASANFGGADTTYGGVNWEGNTTNGHPASETYVTVGSYSMYHSVPGSAWASNIIGFYPTNPATSLFQDGTSISGGSIDINGLVTGQQYLAKFIFADSRSASAGSLMNVTSTSGNIGSTGPTQYAYASGQYLVVTATWTADGFGDSFIPTINGGSASILNAIQIIAVPEPSAITLVGCLGILGLIRRRR